jgi:hypothetical protein
MYPITYPVSSLRVCDEIRLYCEFFVNPLKKTQWVHCDPITGYFLIKFFTSGSNSLMGTLQFETLGDASRR